jgi:hypothetical protein
MLPEKLKVFPAVKVPLTERLSESKSGKLQVFGPPQTPPVQVSGLVQALPSLQPVPLAAVQAWLNAAPPQVLSPPQEAPVQVLVWVPPQVPAVTLQDPQPLKTALTGLLVPPPQEPLH